MKSEGEQEVIVPQGVWEIGVDIPAGYWTINVTDGGYTEICYGKSMNATKSSITEVISSIKIKSENYSSFKANSDKTHVTLELTEGTFIENSNNSVIFTPFSGKLLELK